MAECKTEPEVERKTALEFSSPVMSEHAIILKSVENLKEAVALEEVQVQLQAPDTQSQENLSVAVLDHSEKALEEDKAPEEDSVKDSGIFDFAECFPNPEKILDSTDDSETATLQGQKRRESFRKQFDDFEKRTRTTPRSVVLVVLWLICFIDLCAGMLLLAIVPFLFRPLPDATSEQIEGGMGVFADVADKLGYSTALTLGSSLCFFGVATAGIFSSSVVRRIGHKGALQVNMLGGAMVFILNGLCKDWPAYWFFICRFMTGLLAGSSAVANQYIFATDDDKERATRSVSLLGSAPACALVLAPVLGRAFSGNDKEHLFWPFYAMAGFSFFGFFIATVVLTSPRTKKIDQSLSKENVDDDYKKRGYFKYVVAFWLARFFDKLGSGQLAHFLNHGMLKFEWIPTNLDLCVMLASGGFILALPMTLTLKSKLGLALTPALCQTVTSLWLVMMIFALNMSLPAYMTFFWLANAWTQAGHLLEGGTIAYLVPASCVDRYLGYNMAVSTLGLGLAPLCLARVLDVEDGPLPYNPWGCSHAGVEAPVGFPPIENRCVFPAGSFLSMSAAVTLLTAVPYILMRSRVPNPRAEKSKSDEEEINALAEYEKTGDIIWLSGKQLHQFNVERVGKGRDPLGLQCGAFENDKDGLDRLLLAARKDIKFQADLMELISFQSEHGMMQSLQDDENNQMLFDSDTAWHPNSEEEFAKWFSEYLKWAGYTNPGNHARIWKGMVMMLFPRLSQQASERTFEDRTRAWKLLSRWMKNAVQFEDDFGSMRAMTQTTKVAY